jgi:hypothetical protein
MGQVMHLAFFRVSRRPLPRCPLPSRICPHAGLAKPASRRLLNKKVCIKMTQFNESGGLISAIYCVKTAGWEERPRSVTFFNTLKLR